MAVVPAGQVQNVDMHSALRKRGVAGDTVAVCGTCGAIVAREMTARHIVWHGAAWASPLLTNGVPGDMR